MLARDPAQRYQTPAEVADALEPFAPPQGGQAPAAPRARRRLALALLLLAGTLAPALAVYRIATDRGEIVIETDDPNVEVIIRRGGQEVTILDLKTRRRIELRSGRYEIALGGPAADLRLSTRSFTLRRGDKKVVTVKHEPPRPAQPTTWNMIPPRFPTVPLPDGVGPPMLPGPSKPGGPPRPGPAGAWRIREIRQLAGHTDGVSAVAFSPPRGYALSGAALKDTDPVVRLWNLDAGKGRALVGHKAGITSVAYSEAGRLGITGSNDGTVRVWHLPSLKEGQVLKGHTDRVLAVAVAPNGKQIASGSRDRTVRLWDAATGKVRTLAGHTDAVCALAYSPDGKRLASGSSDRTIRLWDVETGKEIADLRAHSEGVQSVAFAPDGKRLLSGGLDGQFLLWDVAAMPRGLAGWPVRPLAAAARPVYAVAFTPDGRHVLSGGHDGQIRLVEVATGTVEAQVSAHKGAVRSLAVSPDGRYLLSGGDDRLVKLWQLSR
jgi:hypothetical protein